MQQQANTTDMLLLSPPCILVLDAAMWFDHFCRLPSGHTASADNNKDKEQPHQQGHH